MCRSLAVLCCLLLLPLPPVEAKGKGHGHGKAKVKGDDGVVTIHFSSAERDRVRVFFVERHGKGKCPPGLAKKGNGCLPPGQAKKRYVIGRALSPSVHIEPLSAELRIRIGDPPPGYRYGIVDGDLVKLAVGTLLVVDAIDGLVD